MDYYVVAFLVLISCVVITALVMTVKFQRSQYLLMKENQNLLISNHQNQIYFMERTISLERGTVKNLMDRLMSPDPRTYRILSDVSQKATSPLISQSEVVSMSDESEVRRLADMHPGLGDAIYDDETLNFAMDMGIVTDAINHRGVA